MAQYNFAKVMSEILNNDGSLAKMVSDSKNAVRSAPNTPVSRKVNDLYGDRFIPNRNAMDMEKASIQLKFDKSNPSGENILTFGGKILGKKNTSPRKNASKVTLQKEPVKVLDAPNAVCQFYLNLLDWSSNDVLGVALSNEIYLWNAADGSIEFLMSCSQNDEIVTSLKWCPQAGNICAVGTSLGKVQLYDAETKKLIRTMILSGDSNYERVPSLSWMNYIVTSGSFSGGIHHHDIRVSNHEIDLKYLASGGNDNNVFIWNANETMGTSARHAVSLPHGAAVKAIAWCPWKPGLLSTGGGSADHFLNFWNAGTGASIKRVDAFSQVSGIIWNQEHREILTGHGGSADPLCIWKYPNCQKLATLSGDTTNSRVMSVTASPQTDFVASLESNETIRIWHCFKSDEELAKKKKDKENIPSTSSIR